MAEDLVGTGDAGAVVEADAGPGRVRRPLDLVRLAVTSVALTAVIVTARYFAATSVGVDRDLLDASNQVPIILRLTINVIGGVGIVLVPLAAAIDMLMRRRTRQLVEALGALLLAVSITLVANQLPSALASNRLSTALIPAPVSWHLAFVPVLAGLVAFVTVARLLGRDRWGWFASVTIGAAAVTALAMNSTTTSEIVASLLVGWGVGLATRYALGTPTTQPSGTEVVGALGRVGLHVGRLSASSVTGRGRRYEAVTHGGDRLRVQVFDRDLEGAGLAAAWRKLRLRAQPSGAGVSSMRGQTDHAALLSLAATAAGVRVPRLRAVGEVGPDSTLLAYDQVNGPTFDTLAGKVTDADLDAIYQMARTLHNRGVVHRSLAAEHLIRADNGQVWLAGIHHGAIAASDVQQRIDLAELLCTTALLTDAQRAVAAGARAFGADQLARALPALQPFAFSTETRRRVQTHKEVLVAIRDQLLTLQPANSDTEPLDLRRFKPSSLFTIVAGALAAYLLVSQLAGVDLMGLLRSGDWRWSGLAALLSVLTFVGAALALSGFVPESISYGRTFAAQWAAGFATLVSPPTVGTVAVNVRYLRKSGLHPALAAASVGVSQVIAFLTHVILLIATALLAGQSAQLRFTPSRTADRGHRHRRRIGTRLAAGDRSLPQHRRQSHPTHPGRGRSTTGHHRTTPLEDGRGGQWNPASQWCIRLESHRQRQGLLFRQHQLRRSCAGLPRWLHTGPGRTNPRGSWCRRTCIRRRPHRHWDRSWGRGLSDVALPPPHLLAASPPRLLVPALAAEDWLAVVVHEPMQRTND